MTVCTRFAPSPTGLLHIGGARTALYCWAYAKRHQGQFVLRIEDTDRERSTDANVAAILDAMQWLGLEHDGELVYQTHRFGRYREVVDELLSSGQAYRCNCSKERLETLREQQMQAKEKPRYDGHCRDLNLGEDAGPTVIRFKNPLDGEVIINDLVHGDIKIANSELDDLIIARTDGTPTYNLTVVVDDWEMGITQVIRGDDHINNTPRQINIFKALGAEIPQYAHIPMILGPDGKRLSKRHGATGVMQYREEGYLPQALINYLVRLGWSHGDQEIFSMDDIAEKFDLPAVNKSAAAINPEKLLWLNHHYIMNLPVQEVAAELAWHLRRQDADFVEANGPALVDVVEVQRERAKTLVEMAEKSGFFYCEQVVIDAKAAKHLKPVVYEALKDIWTSLFALTSWDDDQAISDIIKKTAEKHELKLGKLAQPLRVAVTGGTVSPPIDCTLRLIGRERTLTRLQAALRHDNFNSGDEGVHEQRSRM